MRTLVVPVDYSGNSLNAAHYAADLALAIDADVHLLHVVQVPVMPAEAPVGYVFEQMEKDGLVVLERLSGDLTARTKGQVSITVAQKTGGVEYELAQYCRRVNPFAVVMGAPGGTFMRALSGGPAVDAARHLPYPVLVIPARAVFRRIRRVVMACEPEAPEGPIPVTGKFLETLKELFAARFDIVNVAVRPDEEHDEKVFEMYRWTEVLENVRPEVHFLKASSVLEGVDKYVAEHEADWLMVFPRKHGLLDFHRSRSKPLVAHCNVPVMSICEAVAEREVAEAQ